jgi:hypothetical protein
MGFSTESLDHVGAFTQELLRSGCMLSGLAADLVEALPPDAYPGEEPANVVIEMVVGTIRTALGGVDERELERATDLIAAACDRVLEHLQLALELSRRMHGEAGGEAGRVYG